MSIYQFLIAVRQRDGEMLMNEAGETTRYGMPPFHTFRALTPPNMRDVVT